MLGHLFILFMNRLFIGILLRNITEHASFLMNRYQKILYMRDGVDQVSKKKEKSSILRFGIPSLLGWSVLGTPFAGQRFRHVLLDTIPQIGTY